MNRLAGSHQLESLKIESGWKIGDEGLAALHKFTDLQRLELKWLEKVSVAGLENIWKLNGLRALDIDFSDSTIDASAGIILEHIGTMTELEELTLHGPVTDEGLKNLSNLKKLRRLVLMGSEGYTNEGLASLMRALPNLQEIKLAFNPLPAPRK
jgi:hypothetical protein